MDYQVAQRLHAASDHDEPDYENRRVHDMIGLLLAKDAFFPDEPPGSRGAACLDIFAYRADEARQLSRPPRDWPPVFHINDYWRMAYPPLADTLDISLSVEETVAAVQAWVERLK